MLSHMILFSIITVYLLHITFRLVPQLIRVKCDSLFVSFTQDKLDCSIDHVYKASIFLCYGKIKSIASHMKTTLQDQHLDYHPS